MKVLQITRQLVSAGGIEIFVDQSSTALCQAGHTVTVVTGDEGRSGSEYRVISAKGLRPTARDMSGDVSSAIATIAEGEHPDVVILHHIGDANIVRSLAPQCPVVGFVHGYLCAAGKLFRRTDELCVHPLGARCLVDWYRGPCGSSPSPRAAWHSLRSGLGHVKALKEADRVFVASNHIRTYLAGEGIDSAKIDIVDLALPAVEAIRAKPETTSDIVNVLYVGRLVYGKGVHHAIRALALLPNNYSLTIAGGGWYGDSLREYAVTLGLNDRAHFLGDLSRREVEERYQAADILVVPSLWPEPAGLVVAEARAHQLPVVAYDSGGIAEWQRLGGVNVVKRGDIAALAAGITAMTSGTVPDVRARCTYTYQSFTHLLEGLIMDSRGKTASR